MPSTLYVYDNWSTYDELSDAVPLTEELAMKELDEIVRLRRRGVRIDAYLMDAFWSEPNGEYRIWRKDRWPKGPGAWLEACRQNGLMPGLWFPANTAFELEPPTKWRNSLSPDGWGFCCFEGGFMDGFIDALRFWYDEGVRVFKFDFASFGAAPREVELSMLPSEIRAANVAAYRAALSKFRKDCPEAVFCAYNGFDEAEFMTWTDRRVTRVIDPKWLNELDSVYSGDPRPADVPQPDFWRTLDVYADHMVWFLRQGGLGFRQIDNCAFMIGETGTCYQRGKAGWKTSLLLSLVRGGGVHMALGNLENLDDEDAKWYGRAQALMEAAGEPEWVGGVPGRGELYGYRLTGLLALVNPSLGDQSIQVDDGLHLAYWDGSVLFENGNANLGPGAVALFARDPQVNLGHSEGFQGRLEPIALEWNVNGREASANYTPETDEELHIVFRQFDAKGLAVRTSGGAPPKGRKISELLTIEALSAGSSVEVQRPDGHVIWSGLSWAYGVIKGGEGMALHLKVRSSDDKVFRVEPQLYRNVGAKC